MPRFIDVESLAIFVRFWLGNADRKGINCSNGAREGAGQYLAAMSPWPAPQILKLTIKNVNNAFDRFVNSSHRDFEF